MVKLLAFGFLAIGLFGFAQSAMVQLPRSNRPARGNRNEIQDNRSDNAVRERPESNRPQTQDRGVRPQRDLYYQDADGNYVLLAEGETTDQQLYYLDNHGNYVAVGEHPERPEDRPQRALYYQDADGNYVLLAEGETTDQQLYILDSEGNYVPIPARDRDHTHP